MTEQPQPGDSTHGDSTDDQLDLLAALRMLPFARGSDGELAPLGTVPDAFALLFPTLALPSVDLEQLFPVLGGFLSEAETFWERGQTGTLRSGPWTQADADGNPATLEAIALVATPARQPFLLIELLGAEFAELQEVLQHSRDQQLAYENLSRVHAVLAESSRRLERMAAERQSAIALLRQAREQLEERVAERTVELEQSNRQLESESSERERAYRTLHAHQQQLGRLAEQLAVAEERERREIAEFLHDRVGQNLALVKLRLRSLATARPETREGLDEIDGLMDEIISDTRGLTADLGTPLLYELGLTEALQSLVRRFEEVHGIETRFADDERDKPIEESARRIVYQAVRELLHNIVKHAEANLVVVRLIRSGRSLRVTVSDTGAGFDAEQFQFRVTTNGGFGLFNIRERLQHLGGSCTVRSTPGEGTEVELIVPLVHNKAP